MTRASSSRGSASGRVSAVRSESAKIALFVARELRKVANPEKAAPMAAYMKTDMPFYGVQKPGRERILKELRERYPLGSRRVLERAVRELWSRPHREEKYLAIALARSEAALVTPASLGLYEKLIREGAWWDFVDEVAIRLVGRTLLDHRDEVSALLDRWIDDEDLWIRRTAIIAQVGHRDATDWRRLSRYCRARAREKEFFIRKAIGWALRDYSYAAPDRVARFLETNRDRLSTLSFREGAKALLRRGVLPESG